MRVLILVSDKIMLGVSVDRMKYLTIDNSVLCSSTHAACIEGAVCVGVIGSGGMAVLESPQDLKLLIGLQFQIRVKLLEVL